MTPYEARAAWNAHKAQHERYGLVLPNITGYLTDEMKQDYTLAMDAQPLPATFNNSALPSMLTTYIDPEVVRIAFAPLEGANILGETKTGTWLTDTALFPVVEGTGETSSYGDFNTNGRSGVNTNWPARQSYHFQVVSEYGERETERAGLSKLNWISEIDTSAADILGRTSNYTYFFGVNGLQNYGMLNDPRLPPSLMPSLKFNGNNNCWITPSGGMNASANEVYADLQTLFWQLTNQSQGLVNAKSSIVIATHPATAVAFTITNSYGNDVYKLLKENFPNVRFETAVQYGALTAQNPQGIAAGNMVQMIAETIQGKPSGTCSYTEKLRAHRIIPDVSSWKTKKTSGSWGAVIKRPMAFASMVGV